MAKVRTKISDLLTPSQEAIFGFIGKSTRWLTAYEISMLTGVSLQSTKSALKELKRLELVLTRKCIRGFENGEPEFKAVSSSFADRRKERMGACRLANVEPLAKKIRRFLGVKKAREYGF